MWLRGIKKKEKLTSLFHTNVNVNPLAISRPRVRLIWDMVYYLPCDR